MSVLFTSFSTCISHSQQEGMEGQTGISLDGSVMFSYLDPNGIIRGRILLVMQWTYLNLLHSQ